MSFMDRFTRKPEPMWESLKALSRNFSPGGIIDIGANVGDWAKQAHRIFRCPIHMVEAQPSLETHLRRTGFPYTVALLGPENRPSVPFFLLGTGSSVLEQLTTFEKGKTTLPMHRLDDLELGLEAPLLMKLDLQGFELEVLSGAQETLKRTEVVLAEVSLLPYNAGAPQLYEVTTYMEERDFLPFDICNGLRRYSDGALIWVDIIFVRRDSQLRAPRKFWETEP